jgi:hypothetical protein
MQIAIASMLLVATSHAQTPSGEFAQKAKHEHGKVTFNLALEDGVLVAELEAPAINVVGFERAPRSDQEKATVARAEAWLKSGRELLGVPAAAGCRHESTRLEPPDWAAAKDHDHDHDHDHADEGHADYRASLTFRCARPADLAWVEVWALRRLLEVSEVTLNVVTASVQKSVTTARADERIALR